MIGAVLIFGGNQKNREEKAVQILKALKLEKYQDNPDVLIIEKPEDKKSIGIDQVREAIQFVSEKPFSHENKAVYINRAHQLTIPAQNALLKTLEEPPTYASIILCAKTENDLLETIISRCRRLDVGKESAEKIAVVKDTYESILEMTIGERLTWAETFAKNEKEDICETLEQWISQIRKLIPGSENRSDLARNIRLVEKVKKDLETSNLNTRLAVEFLVIHIKSI